MKLFIRVKFRAFKVTLATVEQEIYIGAFVVAVVRRQVERVAGKELAARIDQHTVEMSVSGALGGKPMRLFDERGIYAEVRP